MIEIKEKVLNKKRILIFRELTKTFEEIIRTDFDNLNENIKDMKDKGEFTILIQ
ncbi:MAG: hypothetical protein WC422_01815 [Candidatus Paceibacterota bacterium]